MECDGLTHWFYEPIASDFYGPRCEWEWVHGRDLALLHGAADAHVTCLGCLCWEARMNLTQRNYRSYYVKGIVKPQ